MKKPLIVVLVVAVIIIIAIIAIFASRDADAGTFVPYDQYLEAYNKALANWPHQIDKIDTRFQYRDQYHCAVFGQLVKHLHPEAAMMATGHASKAQRGWRDSRRSTPNIAESPGRLWCCACFGILAGPSWYEAKPWYIDLSGRRWRAYPNITASVEDYLDVLATSHTGAWYKLLDVTDLTETDCMQFAWHLRDSGYYVGTSAEDWGRNLWNICRTIVSGDLRNHCMELVR